jgi:hypothetical protein
LLEGATPAVRDATLLHSEGAPPAVRGANPLHLEGAVEMPHEPQSAAEATRRVTHTRCVSVTDNEAKCGPRAAAAEMPQMLRVRQQR